MIHLILMGVGISCLLAAIVLFLQMKLKEVQERFQNMGAFLDTKTGGQDGPITKEIMKFKSFFSRFCFFKPDQPEDIFDYIDEEDDT